MMLRAIAISSLALGAAMLAIYFHVLGLLPFDPADARHLRAMKSRRASPATFTDFTQDSFAALPRHTAVAAFAPLEQRGVRLVGYVQGLLRAPDEDVHLEIVPIPRMPGDGSIRYVTGEITPAWRHGTRWTLPALVQAFRPLAGGVTPWDAGTRRVRFTGWLMNDFEHHGPPPLGPPRVSPWEIHPVTRIELWDDTLHAWQDLAR